MAQKGEIREARADEGRGKSLEVALSQIEKQFGQGAIMKLGSAAAKVSVPSISTGALSVD
ncbi:MAG TPA: DNA recombination/repair protein RecA, partial [bacterium]|nr:DNA recombination/repair protein RecA [bacterium]